MTKRFAWWRSRRRRVVVAAVVLLGAVFAIANVALAYGQWDPERKTFHPGSSVMMSLSRGDERIVYLGAVESQPLNFDFYPSDFSCTAETPDGLIPLETVSERRLLNLWEEHAAIGSFVAREPGGYELSCTGRDATLHVARPARLKMGWVSPQLGIVAFVLVVVLGGVALSIDLLVNRRRRRSLAPN